MRKNTSNFSQGYFGHWRCLTHTRFVYVERQEEIERTVAPEKLVKKWWRWWKFALIEADNPE